MIKLVSYKGKEYNVRNSGEILRNEKGYLMDQLSDDPNKCMGQKRKAYIRNVYGLSEEDYYIIVCLDGDPSRLQDCPYEGCTNKVKFGSLNGTDRLFSRGCCEKHSRSLAERENNRIRVENGTHILLSQNRSGHFIKGKDYYSSVASERAIRQVNNGLHPWAGENGTRLFHKRVEEGSIFLFNTEFSSNLQKERISKGVHQFQDKEISIKADRTIFLNKGDINDECYFYISKVKGDKDNFKIGVTSDPEYRMKFHHMEEYESLEIKRTSDRTTIANLEYEVKLKFKDFTSKGTETFPNYMREEIENFIKTL